MPAMKITQQNFDTEVLSSKKTVLLDFWAPWCGPCRMMGPIVDEIADERTDVLVGKVNVDEEEALAAKFGITSIPTLVILKDGNIVHQSAGVRPKQQLLSLL